MQKESLIAGDIYRHYKGREYRIIGVGFDSDTEERVVVYQGLYDSQTFGNQPIWVRKYDIFTGTVTIDGETRPRFIFVERGERKP